MGKRAIATWILLCAGLGLAGCSSTDPAPEADGAPTPTETETAPADDGAASEPSEPAAAPSPPRALPSTHDYRADYPELPEMGETQAYFKAHGRRSQIDRGFFRGALQLAGAGLTKEGAGPTETIIDGDVDLSGDRWVLRGLTITGDVTIRGDQNDLAECEVLGRVDVMGSGNKKPPGR